MNKKSTGLLLSVLGVISLVLITAGVTYAFFSYTKEGLTENTISTGTITFLYDENEGEGNGINIQDALPMSDEDGMAQTGTNNVFNFTVTSEISGQANIDYVVTARKDKEASTLANNQVKLYLENLDDAAAGTFQNYTYTTTGEGEDEVTTVKLFSELVAPTDITLPTGVDERVMFEGTVPAAPAAGTSTDYEGNFNLRMWIKGGDDNTIGADYSPYEFVLKSAVTANAAVDADAFIEAGNLITSTAYYALDAATRANYERIAYVNMTDRTVYTVSQVTEANGFTFVDGEDGQPTTTVESAPAKFVAGEQFYSLNGQTFKVRVNVYANAAVVTDESGN